MYLFLVFFGDIAFLGAG